MSYRLSCFTSVTAPLPLRCPHSPVRSYPLTAIPRPLTAPHHTRLYFRLPHPHRIAHVRTASTPHAAPLYVRSAAALTSALRLAPALHPCARLLLLSTPASESEGACTSALASITVSTQYSAATVKLGHKSGPTHCCAGPNGVSRSVLDHGFGCALRAFTCMLQQRSRAKRSTARLVESNQQLWPTFAQSLLLHSPSASASARGCFRTESATA